MSEQDDVSGGKANGLWDGIDGQPTMTAPHHIKAHVPCGYNDHG